MNTALIKQFEKEILAIKRKVFLKLEKEGERLRGSDDFQTFVQLKKDLRDELVYSIKDRFGNTKFAKDLTQKFLDEFLKKTRNLDLVVSKRGVRQFLVQGMRVILFGYDLDEKRYMKIVDDVYRKLRDKNLLKVWYGEIYIISRLVKKTTSFEEEQEYTLLGMDIPKGTIVGGEYSPPEDAITLTGGISEPRFEKENLLHEFGHRYYYKILSKPVRQRWNDLLRTKVHSYDQPFLSGKKTMDGKKSPIKAVSRYGSQNSDEAFAEAFLKYCTNQDLNRDQLEFFKRTILNVDEDKKLLTKLIQEMISDLFHTI